MIVKEKVKLYSDIRCTVVLKLWDTETGFNIDYEKNEENSIPSLMCKGKTLKQCINNLNEEAWFDKRTLFSIYTANEIIDTFDLSEEDINFITELGEWADF